MNIHYGDWRVVQTIGFGSFGTVYEIERESFGFRQRAALKVISIMFPTIPQPKLRPRFAIVHGHVETYTPAKTKVFEAYVAAYYKKMTEGYKFDQGTPLAVTILFAMPVPSSKTKTTTMNSRVTVQSATSSMKAGKQSKTRAHGKRQNSATTTQTVPA